MSERKPQTGTPPAEAYSERRRSHRVHITMPILVRGGLDAKHFEEQALTIAVSAHGCLLKLAAIVERGQEVSIINPKTAEELPCTITFVGQRDSGKTEIGLEFVESSPLFWRIAFPPEDWDPSERKRSGQPSQQSGPSTKPTPPR
jgi:PilZ domain